MVRAISPPKNKFYTLTINTMKWINIEKWTRFWHLVTCWEKESRRSLNWSVRVYEKCLCDCGNVKRVPRQWLRKWTQSCWCLQKKVVSNTNSTHRMRESRIYSIYTGIKTRCNNPHEKTYKNYWARWIKCERESFEEFYRDMWPSYEEHVKQYWEKNTTIERIDVNWNYCKENCTRKTKKEQVNNQRSNTICIINWEQHNLCEWSKILWIPRETLKRHLVKWKIKWEIFRRWTWVIYPYKEFGWN